MRHWSLRLFEGVPAVLNFVTTNWLKITAAALFPFVLLVVGWAVLFWQSGPHNETVRVDLPRGSSLQQIASKLNDAGVLSNRFVFYTTLRLRGDGVRLQAGEYDIPVGASMSTIATILKKGAVVLHAVTVAEGLTSLQIIEQLRADERLSGEVAVPPEGSLLPETYMVSRGMGRAALMARMQAAQTALIDTLWPQRAKGLPITDKGQLLTLASIVEKETGVAHERPLVAAVFINRLNKKMRLQSDPTIIYGLVGGVGSLGHPIRLSELNRKTAYNTYRIDGLPPTPIANPGREAIAAVLHPVDSRALYFVADGTGGHVFADTLAAHNRNVSRWRRIEKNLK